MYTCIHTVHSRTLYENIAEHSQRCHIIVVLSLLVIFTATLFLVARSMRWRILCSFISFKSIATVSLNSVAREKPTMGLGSALLYLWQKSQNDGNSPSIFRNSRSFFPEFLTKLYNLVPLGWLNCQCNFFAI